jgi:hypothetical protein
MDNFLNHLLPLVLPPLIVGLLAFGIACSLVRWKWTCEDGILISWRLKKWSFWAAAACFLFGLVLWFDVGKQGPMSNKLVEWFTISQAGTLVVLGLFPGAVLGLPLGVLPACWFFWRGRALRFFDVVPTGLSDITRSTTIG